MEPPKPFIRLTWTKGRRPSSIIERFVASGTILSSNRADYEIDSFLRNDSHADVYSVACVTFRTGYLITGQTMKLELHIFLADLYGNSRVYALRHMKRLKEGRGFWAECKWQGRHVVIVRVFPELSISRLVLSKKDFPRLSAQNKHTYAEVVKRLQMTGSQEEKRRDQGASTNDTRRARKQRKLRQAKRATRKSAPAAVGDSDVVAIMDSIDNTTTTYSQPYEAPSSFSVQRDAGNTSMETDAIGSLSTQPDDSLTSENDYSHGKFNTQEPYDRNGEKYFGYNEFMEPTFPGCMDTTEVEGYNKKQIFSAFLQAKRIRLPTTNYMFQARLNSLEFRYFRTIFKISIDEFRKQKNDSTTLSENDKDGKSWQYDDRATREFEMAFSVSCARDLLNFYTLATIRDEVERAAFTRRYCVNEAAQVFSWLKQMLEPIKPRAIHPFYDSSYLDPYISWLQRKKRTRKSKGSRRRDVERRKAHGILTAAEIRAAKRK